MISEIDKIFLKLEKNDIFQPILFVWTNKELLNKKIDDISSQICKKYSIPEITIKKLSDDNQSIKIEKIREFTSFGDTKSSYKFQIFIIENIERLTLQSSNALLKFLEEPYPGNIVFLSNSSTSNILETILSRVVVINTFLDNNNKKSNLTYIELIQNFYNKKNNDLFYYFYNNSKNLEKDDYIFFLETLLNFHIENNIIHILDEIYDSISKLKNTQSNPKYIIDSILLKI